MPNYSEANAENWFPMHFPCWETILPKINPKIVLEIGSYEGRTSCFLADFLLKDPSYNLSITSIDTWEGGREHFETDFKKVEEIFDHNMKILKSKYHERIELIKLKGDSSIQLAKIYSENQSKSIYDFIYIDGSHDAADVLLDAVLSFKLVKNGGLICFDDFLWDLGNKNILHAPRIAIESFINCNRDQIFLFDSGQARQCWIQRIK